jgi:hypothetical protein
MSMRTTGPSEEMDGRSGPVRGPLAGRQYSIDYYHRECKWRQKQSAQPLDDFVTTFRENHDDADERSGMANSAHYFLGLIIVSDKDGQKFIIVGQNLLARSFHEQTLDHNPGFRQFLHESELPFRSHAELQKTDPDGRLDDYQKLAEHIWSADRLAQEAGS